MPILLKQRHWQQLGEFALGALQTLQQRRQGTLGDVNTIDLRQVIIDEAQAQGVPPEIATAVAVQESGIQQWRNDGSLVTGTSGEIGVFQLMPATAAQLGVDPEDPIQNIQGGVKYLAQMFSQFGSWDLALVAYNWGPGNVQNYLDNSRNPNTFAKVMQNYAQPILSRAGAGSMYTSSPADASSGDYGSSRPATSSNTGIVAVGVIAAGIAVWNWFSD